MTLRLDLEERHEEHADEGTCHGKLEGCSGWLEGIMRVVAGGRRFLGNASENCCADTEANRDREFGDCLKNRTGDGLLRFGQRGEDIHLRYSESAKLRNQLERFRTHFGNIELEIGADDNDGQGRKRECPIRVTGALDSNEEEGNGVSCSSYPHQ